MPDSSLDPVGCPACGEPSLEKAKVYVSFAYGKVLGRRSDGSLVHRTPRIEDDPLPLDHLSRDTGDLEYEYFVCIRCDWTGTEVPDTEE